MNKICSRGIIILLLSSVLFYSFQQITSENQVYWDNHKKLAWNDYLSSPDILDSSNSALTYYGISCSMKTKKDSVTIIVRAIFDKNKSWAKQNEKTDSLLMHEQGHFDIAEIYARIFKKTMKEIHLKKATMNDDLNVFYKKNSINLNTEQAAYDDETDHGRIPLKQGEWNEKIKKRLEEFELYSEKQVTTSLVH